MNESNPVTRFEMQVYFADGRGLVMCDYLSECLEYISEWRELIDYVRIVPIKLNYDLSTNNKKIKKPFL